MSLSLPILLIIIGIVLAILVNYALGIIVILIGLAMLLVPMFTSSGRRVLTAAGPRIRLSRCRSIQLEH